MRQRVALSDGELDGLDPLLARLYAARGVRRTADLDHRLVNLLPIGGLGNVQAAVDLLLRHRDGRIMVVGDFDADGATSTALVLRCLKAFGFAGLDYLVPNRLDFGYGLTPELVQVALPSRPTLIVTVDNGISSVAGVACAREAGIEVLVTDHHLPPDALPDAEVIVNPNLADSAFESPNLAGVGVAFYVMAALGRQLDDDGSDGAARVPARYLDLVALGTVADVVPLDRNNRVLVSEGIDRIRRGRTVPGIRALLDVAGRDAALLTSSDLGFAVGPRLNAAGRLEDMSIGIECLLTDDATTAARLAAELDRINRDRRDIEARMRDQAFAAVDRLPARDLPHCVVLFDPAWHPGIVGLVAARVRERCHRPCIAFAEERDGALKGSGRSVPGVHMRDLLEAVACRQPGLIGKFGGHAMAAGLSIARDDFDAFRSAADAAMCARYADADLSGAILTDGSLPPSALDLNVATLLREAGPWGAGFPEPTFQGDFTIEDQRVVGERHLKMRLSAPGVARPIDAIAFNQAVDGLRGQVRIAYRLDVNHYRGRASPQLVVEQITRI